MGQHEGRNYFTACRFSALLDDRPVKLRLLIDQTLEFSGIGRCEDDVRCADYQAFKRTNRVWRRAPGILTGRLGRLFYCRRKLPYSPLQSGGGRLREGTLKKALNDFAALLTDFERTAFRTFP